MKSKKLSIIMPVRNEEGNLARAYEEVTTVMAPLPYDYEVIVVDNDSVDRSGVIATDLCAHDERWRYVKFSRNFGLEASIAAGYRLAEGDAAIVLFGDLQDPPELIGEFLEKWEDGYEVVYGVIRRRTGDPLWKSKAAGVFYRALNCLSDVNLPMSATDFRLLSRRAIDSINRLDEHNRFVRGYSHWIGLKQCPLVYDRRPRIAGRSKATFCYLLDYAINAITCFSIKPLRLLALLGMANLALTAALTLTSLTLAACGLRVAELNTTNILLMANLSVVLLSSGIVGEYVGRTYEQTRHRPLFIIEHAVNISSQCLDMILQPALAPADVTHAVHHEDGLSMISTKRFAA